MRNFTALFAAFLIFALPYPENARQQQPESALQNRTLQKSETAIVDYINLVSLLVTVLDQHNKPVPDLTAKDFQVTDEGARQRILYFGRQSDISLRIGLLLDTSDSNRSHMKFEQGAVSDFLDGFLRLPGDQAFVMSTDSSPQVVQGFTGDTGVLSDGVRRTKSGGSSATYDAIYDACAKQLRNPPRPPADEPDIVRRVIILVSEGEDTSSVHTLAETIEMAQRTAVAIYTIDARISDIPTIADDNNSRLNLSGRKKAFQYLARETGGRSFSPKSKSDLEQALRDLGDELRNQYQISYSPSNLVANGKYHHIKIETPKFSGYQVHSRPGYFAPSVNRDVIVVPRDLQSANPQ